MANTPKAAQHRGMRPIRRKETNDIRGTLGKLMRDRKRIERLLALEKQRGGVPTNALVFVGMRNVAQHWWCTQQAVLRSRAEELGFFTACLQDRIEYAFRLKLIDKLPRPDEEVLTVGRKITLSNVEGFRESDQKIFPSGQQQGDIVSDIVVTQRERLDI